MAAAVILESIPAGGSTGLDRRRVYIFLTRQGFMFALLLIVMLLGAVNYVNSMAYLMTFLLASLFMVCMLHTYRNLRGLVLSAGTAEPVFAGDSARLPLLFDNRGGGARSALRVFPAPRRRGAVPVAVLEFALAAGTPEQHHLEVPTTRRGRLAIGRLAVDTRFPLGLFRAWSYIDGGECLVYPRPAGSRSLPPAREASSEHEAGRRPGTDDFAGYATYRAGDSIRRIDWRALAREQGLLVKRFSGNGSQRLVLDWALLPESMPVEARLSQLCRWVMEAERHGHEYALVLPGRPLPARSGAQHRHACLEALALFGTPGIPQP